MQSRRDKTARSERDPLFRNTSDSPEILGARVRICRWLCRAAHLNKACPRKVLDLPGIQPPTTTAERNCHPQAAKPFPSAWDCPLLTEQYCHLRKLWRPDSAPCSADQRVAG